VESQKLTFKKDQKRNYRKNIQLKSGTAKRLRKLTSTWPGTTQDTPVEKDCGYAKREELKFGVSGVCFWGAGQGEERQSTPKLVPGPVC